MSNTAAVLRNEWIVTVDGADRRVSAERDEESGRVNIRIDGRMAARSLAPGETERRFKIGSAGYMLQITPEGALDLDLDPDAPLPAVPPPAYVRPEPKEKPRSNTARWIVSAVILLILIPAARWTIDAVRYMRVPWESYTDPVGRQFRLSFPDVPERSTKRVAAGLGSTESVKLASRYHQHVYVLEYIDLPFVITRDREGDLITRAFETLVKSEQATIVQNGWSRAAGRDSMHFVLHMPDNAEWSGGTARGHVLAGGKRLYIQYAYVPRGESTGYDVGEYLRSLELADTYD